MNNGWQTKTLGDVAAVQSGAGFPDRYQGQAGGEIPFYKVSDMNIAGNEREMIHENNSITEKVRRELGAFLFPKGSTIFPKIGGAIATNKKRLTTRDCCVDNNVMGVIPKPGTTDCDFLFYYFLAHDLSEFANEAHLPSIKKSVVAAWPIPVPPLPEQRRIVGILDEAFEAIATAKANAEKNLQNARALFESHLNAVFTQRGEGWITKPLADCLQLITYGFTNPMPTTTEGPYMITAKNVVGGRIDYASTRRTSREAFDTLLTDKSRPQVGDVLLTKDGTLGRVAVVDQPDTCINQSVALLRPNGRMNPQFMCCLLSSSDYQQRMVDDAGGTTIKHIYITRVDKMLVTFPESIEEQQRVVAGLDSLNAETQRIKSLYQRKLAALEALKKSLLHQAFTGQLTASNEIVAAAAPIPFPTELSGISTTDLHAGILAMAHQLHEKAGRLEHFGHVKAEKIAHMIEAKLGISLGRNPVKDAAGPNDFGHLKKVEHRAKMTNCYEFRRTDGAAYRVQKLRGFERLIDKTRTALGDRLSEVEKLLRWMLPMNVQQAEIVATVYAAWNNLLLDGKQPTDEEIVNESREDWHPKKLKIPREKFFSAVNWLREQGVVPNGNGKRVSARTMNR